MNLIDGKTISQHVREVLKREIEEKGFKPCLAIIQVGNNPASNSYIKSKLAACEEVGIETVLMKNAENVSEETLLDLIRRCNKLSEIDAMLVQLPLPKHIDENKVIKAIDPKKDVDGFTDVNLGKMLLEDTSGFVPCTPLGILNMLEWNGKSLYGKKVTLLGRSNLVGRPLANLLSMKSINATLTWCHTGTPVDEIENAVRGCNCLILCCGKRDVIPYEWVPKDCIVIDVGVNRVPDTSKKAGFRLVGDVYDSGNPEFVKHIEENNITITPVPGGVGPMTVTALLKNVVKAAETASTENV